MGRTLAGAKLEHTNTLAVGAKRFASKWVVNIARIQSYLDNDNNNDGSFFIMTSLLWNVMSGIRGYLATFFLFFSLLVNNSYQMLNEFMAHRCIHTNGTTGVLVVL